MFEEQTLVARRRQASAKATIMLGVADDDHHLSAHVASV